MEELYNNSLQEKKKRMSLFRADIFLPLSLSENQLCGFSQTLHPFVEQQLLIPDILKPRYRFTSLVANGDQSSWFQLDANNLQNLKIIVPICECSLWR